MGKRQQWGCRDLVKDRSHIQPSRDTTHDTDIRLPRAGKTVLCDRYIKKAFLDPMNSDFSVEVNVGSMAFPTHNLRLNIYNVPGRETYRVTSGAAPVSQAHGIMLVFDVTDRRSFESLNQLYSWIVLMKVSNSGLSPSPCPLHPCLCVPTGQR